MSGETFSELVRQIKEFGIRRVNIVGNGESTFHPQFSAMVRKLGASCKYVHMVSNGQLLTEATIRSILLAPVRMLEVSVDSNDKEGYEASRLGGSFKKLLENLLLLKRLRRELHAPTLINITAMIRPSQRSMERDIVQFWSTYADIVMPQYLHDITGGRDKDVFEHLQRPGVYPACTVPSKGMVVHWNGNVPLCGKSAQQIGNPEGLLVGNIWDTPLKALWSHPTFSGYREGHRNKDTKKIPICKGCSGG